MKDSGGSNALDYPYGMQYGRVAILGAGAAAPTVPVDGDVQPNYPKKANMLSRLAAEIPARSGVGAYTVQWDSKFFCKRVLNANAEVFGAAGMWCQISAIANATRTLTLKVFNAAGAATDLANGTDLLVVSLEMQDGNG